MSFDDLDRTILWVSHILIGHNDSAYDAFDAIRPQEWGLDDERPRREPAAAAALARNLANQLRSAPERFATIARTYSDDLGTRDLGGSLGGVRASQLGATFLDALQATPVGVPIAFETKQGFHIIQRAPPPVREIVAGQRIVIRYRGDIRATLLGESTRTRREAYQLAISLAQSTEPFSSLVARHSEDEDKVRDGDIGVWSTTVPEHNGTSIEALTSLSIGEVSSPVDTPVGYQILKRVAPTDRVQLATTAIQFPYDPTAKTIDSTSRAGAEQAAIGAIGDIAKRPELFAEMQVKMCCGEVLQWERGRGGAALEQAILSIAEGKIFATPIDVGWRYFVAKRVKPVLQPEALISYELETPSNIELDRYLRHSDGAALAETLKKLRRDMHRELSFLPLEKRSFLDSRLVELEKALLRAKSGSERVDANRDAIAAIDSQLDRQAALHFHSFARTWLTNYIMAR